MRRRRDARRRTLGRCSTCPSPIRGSSTERVGDGITLVTEPHVHPLLRCNVWHVRGRDPDLVVDTSLGLRPLRHLVERELGHDLLAVATHVHSDHIGGMHEFDERAIHAAEADELAATGASRSTPRSTARRVLGPYRDAGYDIPELLVDAVPAGRAACGRRSTRPAAPATRLLADGDVVDLGDRAFEVLHLPGHSPGSIGLWEAATGVLFSGDAVYDGPLLDELRRLRRRRLRRDDAPAARAARDVVHAGHEPSFGRDRLVELCDAYLHAEPA